MRTSRTVIVSKSKSKIDENPIKMTEIKLIS